MALQNHAQIQKLLKLIGGDFISSHNPNTRKGALVGLAAIAIALGKVTYNGLKSNAPNNNKILSN